MFLKIGCLTAKNILTESVTKRKTIAEAQKKAGRFVRVDTLPLTDQQAVRGWLKGFDQEVLLVRRIFINKDGSTGLLNLVCSDLTLTGEKVTTIYEKRWKVEVFHKSLKSNAALAKSPTRTTTTQNNHVFMSIVTVFKMECLKLKHKLNHFALRTKGPIPAEMQQPWGLDLTTKDRSCKATIYPFVGQSLSVFPRSVTENIFLGWLPIKKLGKRIKRKGRNKYVVKVISLYTTLMD